MHDGGGNLSVITSVLFFKRILNFTQETAPLPDLRQAARHAVGLTFPFKAVLSLSPHEADGKLIAGQINGQDWAGRLTNLSATGGEYSAWRGLRRNARGALLFEAKFAPLLARAPRDRSLFSRLSPTGPLRIFI